MAGGVDDLEFELSYAYPLIPLQDHVNARGLEAQPAVQRHLVQGELSQCLDLLLLGLGRRLKDIEVGDATVELSGASSLSGNLTAGDTRFEVSGASSAELLRRPEVVVEELARTSILLQGLDADERRIVAETIKYAGYVDRQARETERRARAGARSIPDNFGYRGLSGLSNELVEKLEAARPVSLGHASRIDGMTPAALALLAAHLEQRPERRPR